VWLFVLLIGTLALSHVRAEDDDDDDKDDAPKTETKEEAKPTEDADSTKPDDEEVDDSEGLSLKASPDILTTVHFPEQSDKKFSIGGDVQVLLGLHNKGKDDFNISYIGASLHSPFDLTYHIQNFSWVEVGATVKSGEEHTFGYTFRPDPRLEPLEFWLTAFVYYNNTETGAEFKSTFYNSTIELIERPTDMNARRVFTYFLAIAAAGIVGYIVYHMSAPKSSVERGTRGDDTSSSWVPAKVYSQSDKSRVVGRKTAKKPNGPKGPTATDS